jgi:hypothetical protein
VIDHFGFKYSLQTPLPWGYTQTSNGITDRGALGGLQIGVNYQLPFWHLVAGLEIDNSAVNVTGHTAINGAFPSGATYLIDFGTRIHNIGTARRDFLAQQRIQQYGQAYFRTSDVSESVPNMPSTPTLRLRPNISTNSSSLTGSPDESGGRLISRRAPRYRPAVTD